MVTSKNTIIRLIAMVTVVAFVVTNCGLGYALRQVNARESDIARAIGVELDLDILTAQAVSQETLFEKFLNVTSKGSVTSAHVFSLRKLLVFAEKAKEEGVLPGLDIDRDILSQKMLNVGLENVGLGYGKLEANNIVTILRSMGLDVYGLDPAVAADVIFNKDPDFINGSVERMPFEDNSFGVIISIGLFEPNYAARIAQKTGNEDDFYRQAAAEIRRVLKDGGLFLADTFIDNPKFLKACENEGFVVMPLSYELYPLYSFYLMRNHKPDTVVNAKAAGGADEAKIRELLEKITEKITEKTVRSTETAKIIISAGERGVILDEADQGKLAELLIAEGDVKSTRLYMEKVDTELTGFLDSLRKFAGTTAPEWHMPLDDWPETFAECMIWLYAEGHNSFLRDILKMPDEERQRLSDKLRQSDIFRLNKVYIIAREKGMFDPREFLKQGDNGEHNRLIEFQYFAAIHFQVGNIQNGEKLSVAEREQIRNNIIEGAISIGKEAFSVIRAKLQEPENLKDPELVGLRRIVGDVDAKSIEKIFEELLQVSDYKRQTEKVDSNGQIYVVDKTRFYVRVGNLFLIPENTYNFNLELSNRLLDFKQYIIILEPFSKNQSWNEPSEINPIFSYEEHTYSALLAMQAYSYMIAGKNILDAGCGSGALTVAALKLGASSVVAIDSNSKEVSAAEKHIQLNHCPEGRVYLQQMDFRDFNAHSLRKITNAAISNIYTILANLPYFGAQKESARDVLERMDAVEVGISALLKACLECEAYFAGGGMVLGNGDPFEVDPSSISAKSELGKFGFDTTGIIVINKNYALGIRKPNSATIVASRNRSAASASGRTTFSKYRSSIIFATTALAFLTFDLITKVLIYFTVPKYEYIQIIPGILTVTHYSNEKIFTFFSVFLDIAIVIFLFAARNFVKRQYLQIMKHRVSLALDVSFGLMAAEILGNGAINSLFKGGIVDWIQFFSSYRICNLADLSGAAGFIYISFILLKLLFLYGNAPPKPAVKAALHATGGRGHFTGKSARATGNVVYVDDADEEIADTYFSSAPAYTGPFYAQPDQEALISRGLPDLRALYPDIDEGLAKLPQGANILVIGPGYGFEILDIKRGPAYAGRNFNFKSIGLYNFYDFSDEPERKQHLRGLIEKRYGISSEEAEQEIAYLQNGFTRADIDEIVLTYKTGSFDAVIMGYSTMMYLKNKAGIIKEAYRVLKPNGIGFMDLCGMMISDGSAEVFNAQREEQAKKDVVEFFNRADIDLYDELTACLSSPLPSYGGTGKDIDRPLPVLMITKKVDRNNLNLQLEQKHIYGAGSSNMMVEYAVTKEMSSREVFSPRTMVVDIESALVGGEVWPDERYYLLAKRAGVPDSLIHSYKGKSKKQEILEKISQSDTICFLGHGGPNHLWLVGGRGISAFSEDMHNINGISCDELADRLRGEQVIILDTCYAGPFKDNVEKRLKEKGSMAKPIIIPAAVGETTSSLVYYVDRAYGLEPKGPLTMLGIVTALRAAGIAIPAQGQISARADGAQAAANPNMLVDIIKAAGLTALGEGEINHLSNDIEAARKELISVFSAFLYMFSAPFKDAFSVTKYQTTPKEIRASLEFKFQDQIYVINMNIRVNRKHPRIVFQIYKKIEARYEALGAVRMGCDGDKRLRHIDITDPAEQGNSKGHKWFSHGSLEKLLPNKESMFDFVKYFADMTQASAASEVPSEARGAEGAVQTAANSSGKKKNGKIGADDPDHFLETARALFRLQGEDALSIIYAAGARVDGSIQATPQKNGFMFRVQDQQVPYFIDYASIAAMGTNAWIDEYQCKNGATYSAATVAAARAEGAGAELAASQPSAAGATTQTAGIGDAEVRDAGQRQFLLQLVRLIRKQGINFVKKSFHEDGIGTVTFMTGGFDCRVFEITGNPKYEGFVFKIFRFERDFESVLRQLAQIISRNGARKINLRGFQLISTPHIASFAFDLSTRIVIQPKAEILTNQESLQIASELRRRLKDLGIILSDGKGENLGRIDGAEDVLIFDFGAIKAIESPPVTSQVKGSLSRGEKRAETVLVITNVPGSQQDIEKIVKEKEDLAKAEVTAYVLPEGAEPALNDETSQILTAAAKADRVILDIKNNDALREFFVVNFKTAQEKVKDISDIVDTTERKEAVWSI